jgi:hypothetical protein
MGGVPGRQPRLAALRRFAGGRGEFYGDDTVRGTDVRVRFVWSGITATTARWERAFSVDGEKTWITNWIMDSTRR